MVGDAGRTGVAAPNMLAPTRASSIMSHWKPVKNWKSSLKDADGSGGGLAFFIVFGSALGASSAGAGWTDVAMSSAGEE